MARYRPPTKALPTPVWGVIGTARYACTGTASVSGVEVTGCIAAVIPATGFLQNIVFSAQQQFYTCAATCQYATNASIVDLSSTATTTTPSGFQVQTLGVNPVTGIASTVVMVTVFGSIRTPGRSTKLSLWGGRKPMDIVGMCTFGIDAGFVTRLRKAGCVQGVNRIDANGNAEILLSPNFKYYTVVGSVSSDGVNSAALAINGSAGFVGATATKVQVQGLGTNPPAARNAQVFCVAIIGQRLPNMRGSWNGNPLGVIGAARFSVTGATTLGTVQTWGCVSRVTPFGALWVAQVELWPKQPFYTWMGMASGDLINPTYTAWSTTSGVDSSSIISVASTGINPPGGRNTSVAHLTVIGPLKGNCI